MKIVIRALFVFIGIFLASFNAFSDEKAEKPLFQVSTMAAVRNGVYDGDTNIAILKNHGDIGLGTLNGLDGELTALDGIYYQFKTDGKAYVVLDSQKTPFSVMVFFEADKTIDIKPDSDFNQLQQFLDGELPSKNLIYAFKIKGVFSYMKTRSVPLQTKPYKPLSEVVKQQSIFEYKDTEGTLIGFKFPKYLENVNYSEYHFHFINNDKTAGGHVLDLKVKDVKAEIDSISDFNVKLPETEDYLSAEL